MPPGLEKKQRHERKIIAVGGGKGGIGKTLVSANLAIALAQKGHKVTLVDLDLGGANLHTCLGVPQPALTLSDFVTRRTTRLEQLMVQTGVNGLTLIAGANDVLDAANPKYQQKQKLLRHLQALDTDYLLLDLGAGTSFNVLDFFLLADYGALVLLPEPTSIENAYRFVKAAFFRKLELVQEKYEIEDVVEAALSTREGAARTPFDVVQHVAQRDPELAAELQRELATFRVKLVVNQVRTPADVTVGAAVVSAWKKFFGLEMDLLGHIPYDDEAWKAIRKRRPLLLDRPESNAASCLLRIAENLVGLDASAKAGARAP
ncbi:MAG: P-loop NTPase [Myxococcaceae bacterium]